MTGHIPFLAFWTPGPMELVIILVVAVLIFGRRLPEIARGVGKSVTEFKKGIHEVNETKDEVMDDVNKIKDDVVNEAKEASGINDIDGD
jgi:sec-independent protein translocase protein TatA